MNAAIGHFQDGKCLLIITAALRLGVSIRSARLSGAAHSSDQSVYDTDTDVPLDEPSVPVQNVQLESVGSQECLVSQECVVSEAPSTEVAQSDVLLLSSGDGLEKLASSLFF